MKILGEINQVIQHNFEARMRYLKGLCSPILLEILYKLYLEQRFHNTHSVTQLLLRTSRSQIISQSTEIIFAWLLFFEIGPWSKFRVHNQDTIK